MNYYPIEIYNLTTLALTDTFFFSKMVSIMKTQPLSQSTRLSLSILVSLSVVILY